MIQLPWELGGIVRDAIDKSRKLYNIPEPQEITNLSDIRRRDTFLEEEFELVRELSVNKDTLEYMVLFPSITSLTIEGKKELENIEIRDLIKKYPYLEKLTIRGQNKLGVLDVSELRFLKELNLISDRGLMWVKGLDQLTTLDKFTFYDNIVYPREEEICSIVNNLSSKGCKCDVDVLYISTLAEKGIEKPDNISWSENVGLGMYGEKLSYSTFDIMNAYRAAKEVIDKYVKETDTNVQKYAIIYQWMCENVKYDYAESNSETVVNNGTVKAITQHSCVCQGYSKAMQLLLKLVGIKSFDTSCFVAHDPNKLYKINNRVNEGDHSLLKVNIDGTIYYSDVTWDAYHFQKGENRKYFLISKDEMIKDHKLVGEEQVFVSINSISSEEFNALMKFASDRIRSVNNQKESVNQTTNNQNDWFTKYKNEVDHKNMIITVERLLGIKITPNVQFGFEADDKILKSQLKDAVTLRQEQNIINNKLEELFYNTDVMDSKTYHELKMAVNKEYEKMVSKAPRVAPVSEERISKNKNVNEVSNKKVEKLTFREQLDRVIGEMRKKHKSDDDIDRDELWSFVEPIVELYPEVDTIDLAYQILHSDLDDIVVENLNENVEVVERRGRLM